MLAILSSLLVIPLFVCAIVETEPQKELSLTANEVFFSPSKTLVNNAIKDKNWYTIDQMTPGGRGSKTSFKNWGIKGKKFFMQMGGFNPTLESHPNTFTIPLANEPMPDYLSDESLADLFKLPATIEAIEVDDITSSSFIVKFNVTDIGTNPTVILYYGDNDGLTFVDKNKGNGGVIKWDNTISLSNITNGKITHKISGLSSSTKYYYRLQIINDEGETWSFDTQTFTTK